MARKLGYGITDEAFIYAGVNWPISMTTKDTEVNFKGTLGFQFGAIYQFTDLLFGSVEYRISSAG